MFKYALVFALLTLATCEERSLKSTQYVDPFTELDKHITHSVAYHYLWPWSQLIRAAAALDLEDNIEDPQIISNSEKYQINLSVMRFKPEELKIKVKNRHIVVEGKHKEEDNVQKFMANHFVQRFVLPAGTKQEEVTAVLNEKGVLSVTAPKHDIPPTPPEREVPIQIIVSEEKTESSSHKVETLEDTKVDKDNIATQTSTAAPFEQIDVEATTHVGKIRKKELKTTTKTTKDNEVTKGLEGNGLDYALIEAEE